MMKMPLSFAILKHIIEVGSANQHEVVEALLPIYGKRHGLDDKHVLEFLMTGVKNGLLERCECTLGDKDEMLVSFQATEDGRATIERYLGN